MKKFTFLSILLVLAVVSWGQRVNTNNFKSKTMERVAKRTDFKTGFTGDYATYLKDINLNVIFEEDFEGTWPPTGWTVIDGPLTEHWHQDPGNNFAYNGTQLAYIYWEVGGVDSDDWLISPSITIPSTAQPSKLAFDWISTYHYNVELDDADIFVYISTDGGTTWPTTVWADDDSTLIAQSGVVFPWPSYEWCTSFIDLSAYAGQDIQFAIQYTGNDGGSFWLDNVIIYEAPHYDVSHYDYRPEFGWFDYGCLSQIPWPFPMDLYFWSRARNFGTDDVNNVILDVDVSDQFGSVFTGISETTLILSELAIDSLTVDTNAWYTINETLATSTADLKNYTTTFTLSLDETDEFPADNVEIFNFATTDSVYARDNGNVAPPYTSPATWVGGDVDGAAFGPRFDFTNTADVEVNSLSIHISSYCGEGSTIKAAIWLYDGTNWNEILASDYHDIVAGDIGNWLLLPFVKDQFSEFLVQGLYIAAIQVVAFNGVDFWITEDVETPQANYATFWNLDGTAWEYYGNYNSTPFIRLNIQSDLPVAIDQAGNVVSNVSIYPNPTTGELQISNIKNANVIVYNIVGEVVSSFSNVFNNVDISDLSNGSYIVKVITENNVTTKKINLVK